jgi:hypothetical protein
VLARKWGADQIDIKSDSPTAGDRTYSNTVCVDSKLYGGRLKTWKSKKRHCDGCGSLLEITSDIYDANISLDEEFLSAFQELHFLRINRITGTFNQSILITGKRSGALAQDWKGSCSKTDRRF